MKRQEKTIADAPHIVKTRLRILATSDLHMQMTNFDYAKDRPGTGGSLAKLSTLIRYARDKAAQQGMACLLFDNGDTFQGTPLGDLIAIERMDQPNPMAACMNHLRYDAVGLGNHDFDHGLDKLAACLAQLNMPVVCSNFSSERLPMVQRNLMIDCQAHTDDGKTVDLRVGVLSSLPQKTALWSRHHVAARAHFERPLEALKQQAGAIRKQGADLVVVLAHMGLALFDEGEEGQNQISEVAALDEVDVVIGGHTHLRFPGPDHDSIAEADCNKGTVHGTPVVQPGVSASDLGVIDLDLQRVGEATGWSIEASTVELRPTMPGTPEDPDLVALTAPSHRETRRYLSQAVGNLKNPMNSFFALASPSPVPALLATAKRWTVEKAINGTQYADLPLLSVASAPLTGGFDGPDNFLSLASGPVHRHHVAGMNPYANHVWAVKTTGAQLVDWLERSVLIYNTLTCEDKDQMLVDPRVPGFRYDAIYGLTYEIDPRERPRFDAAGRRVAGRKGRVRNIQWRGKPLNEDQEFLVATTDHRAGGGGLYKTFGDNDIVIQGHAPLQDAVLDYFQTPKCSEVRSARPWKFVKDLRCSAILLTSPQAVQHLDDIAHLKPEPRGLTEEGFLKLRLHF